MFGGSPFYHSHNPYTSPQPQHYPFGYSPYQNPRPVDLDRARALAAQRARRAQWLPDEYDEDDDYDNYRLSSHERAYLNAHRNHALMEREQRRREQEAEEARRRALEEQKWQQELDRQQEEDAAARKRIEGERQRRRQQVLELQSPIHPHADEPQHQQKHTRSSSPPRRSSPPPHTIPIADGNIRTQPDLHPASPQRPTPAPIKYTEKHVEAASVLQRFFRIRQSIHAIQSLISDFNALRENFAYPSTISFQNPLSSSTDVANVTAVDPSAMQSSLDDFNFDTKMPKLAFNSTNYGLLAYNDALDKLLVKLDGVESWGDPEVRRRRRNAVKQIEKEQALTDRFWKMSWLKHTEERGE